MRNFRQSFLLACGLLLTLAAFPILAQEKSVNEINQMPLQDLVEFIREKTATGRIDLTKPFSVEVAGILTNDGTFDLKQSKFVKNTGDEKMIEVGKMFIEAISSSGLLSYLQNIGIDKINITVGQDENESYINIVLEQKSPERAKTISSGFSSLIRAVSLIDKDGTKKMTDAEKFLFSGSKTSTEGNKVSLNFLYQKSAVQEMIKRILEK